MKNDQNQLENKVNGLEIDGNEENTNGSRTEVEQLRTDLDIISEKTYAFKYAISMGPGAIESQKVINFDYKIYGDNVVDGVFTAPVGQFKKDSNEKSKIQN